MEKVIILGSGPAGLTAALYAARAQLAPLVLAGKEPGGQLMLTTEVENFPGFPEGLLGPDLIQKMRAQAERFGARFIDVDAAKVHLKAKPIRVEAGEKTWETKTIIIATGASSLWLNLPSEQQLIGKGVSSCAVCDGFFFKDKKVAVIGGGDSAMEEANFLTRFAKEVLVIHRRDTLRASKIMQQRAFKNPKIKFLWDSEVLEVLGREKVEGVRVQNVKDKSTAEISLDGLFVAIGHKPNTDLFKGQLEMDSKGYLKVKNQTHTSLPGVFVAGDVRDPRYRQAISAAGWGCMAAMDAERKIGSATFY